MVREVLVEVGLTELMDEALLLTTELATNGVVHAGTDLDVEVVAETAGVTVTVTDYRAGPIEPMSTLPPDETSDHGRGLLLVDQFASAWGTSHDPYGKGVWFRLDRAGGDRDKSEAEAAPQPVPVGAPEVSDAEAAAKTRAAEDASWLIHLGDELRQRLTMPQLVSEMLLRLCEVTGAAGGAVWLDVGEGDDPARLASQGAEETQARPLVVNLPVHRPYSGRLELYPDAAASPHWTILAKLSADRMALAVETDRVAYTDRRRRGWLTFLAEAGQLLAQSLDVDLTLALVPQIMVPRLGSWCAVFMTDEEGRLCSAAAVHTDEAALPMLKQRLSGPSGEIASRLAEARRGGGAVPLPSPVEGIAVPLAARGVVLGVLAVGRPLDRAHSTDDVTVLEDAARRAALAIDNARIHSERQRIAQDFQRALLPSALPNAEGISFAAEYVPASTGTDVGGDFYDVLSLGEDRYWLSVGDVCGKGAQAAAVTGLVRDVLRVMMRDDRPLPRALELLNRTLLDQPDEGRYATVATALAERADKDLAVTVYLSGHEPALLLHADGKTEYVGKLGTAVGLLPKVNVHASEVMLRPGDNLIFYTDGVTERRDGETLFGHGNISRSLVPLAGYPAGVVAAKLRNEVLNFSAEVPRDDMAILVLGNDQD